MTDEELMKALGEVARERAEDELSSRRLEALAAGELSGAERRALEKELAGTEDAGRVLDLFAPLDQGFRDRTLDRLPQGAGRAISLPRKLLTRRSLWLGLATAAALLLVWLPPESQPLPEYAVELQGGIKAVRGAAAQTARYGTGSRMEVILRPAVAYAGEVDVLFFLTRPGELLILDAPVEREQRGSVRMVAVLGEDVRIPTGDWTLWVVYGPAGAVVDAEEILRLDAEDLHATRTRVQRIPIHVQPN
jgi:hypothetical protein